MVIQSVTKTFRFTLPGMMCLIHLATASADPAGIAFFEAKIRPVLIEQCFKCHSVEAKANGKLKGDLYLDSAEPMLKGGETGPSIVPGKPGESLLIKAIRYEDEDMQMPPKTRLPATVVADFEKWIAMGAPDPRTGGVTAVAKKGIDIEAGRRFWSFQPLSAVAIPAVKDGRWARTSIDRFVLNKLEEKRLSPNPMADRSKLIRRAFLDLTGLPPTSQEVDAFIGDPSAEAYESLIDRLLTTPRFGERWARHWLDAARFAESDGFEQDYDRPAAYQYRDFVVRAMNDDMPFDRFVQWQLAGDELAPDDWQAMAATGFLTAGVFPTQITEKEFESTRYNQLDDMAATTGTAMLGLTVGCARCHDHKFDPVPTLDYYRLVAGFGSAIRSDIERDLSTPAEREASRRQWEKRRNDLSAKVESYDRVPLVFKPVEYRKLTRELGKLEAAGPAKVLTKIQVTSEGLPPVKNHADGRGYPHFYKESFLLRRGDPNNKVQVVTASFPQVLMRGGKDESHWLTPPPAGARTSFRRAALARWITDAESGAGPLLARVIVNRVWQHHFGKGIVGTPNDFGAQGDRPTHPELLDWLAKDLIDHGWQLKRLHRMIMTSAAYMQNAAISADRIAVDPNDEWLWRWQPHRLEAEPIRDSLLFVAGLLDETRFGPGTLDENMRRRSLYFTVKRSRLIPMMMVLDWPEALNSIGNRPTTTVAPQALLFMNSPQARQCAEGLASHAKSTTVVESIGQAYRIALSRPASPTEVDLAAQFIARQATVYHRAEQADPDSAALVDFCQALLSTNEFVYAE